MNKKEIGRIGIKLRNEVGLCLPTLQEYRELILRLQGINDFQKTRGFIRGLDKHFKREVKRSATKNLEDAINL